MLVYVQIIALKDLGKSLAGLSDRFSPFCFVRLVLYFTCSSLFLIATSNNIGKGMVMFVS